MKVWTQAEEMATRKVVELAFEAGKQGAATLQDTLVGNELQELWYRVHDAVAALGEPTCEADVDRAREVADGALD